MDQLKVVWKYTKKYGFWVICVVGAALVCFVWGQSTKALQNQFDARKGEIEGKFGQMQTIASTANQPNELLITKKNKLLRDQSENIYDTWKDLHAAHKEYCTWDAVPNPDYRKAFEGAYAEKLKDPKYEVRSDARGDYWNNVVPKHLKEIKKTYDLRVPQADSSSAEGTPNRKDTAAPGVVVWRESGFRSLSRRFEWSKRPQTWQILMAQEDLWAYEMMLGIIKKTNVGKSDFNASIKEILSIQVAEEAQKAYKPMKSRVLHISEDSVAPLAEGDAAAGAVATSDDEGGENADAELASLVDNGRYADSHGNPVTYAGLMATKAAGYRILPVYMKVVINQNDISQFLVHCVNAGIPIEIQQVCMSGLSKKTTQPLLLAAQQNDLAEVGTAAGKPVTAPASVASNTSDSSERGSDASNRGPEDVEFELFGLMYFFEPANVKAFESLAGQEEAAENETSPEATEETENEEAPNEEPTPAEKAEEAQPSVNEEEGKAPEDADAKADADEKENADAKAEADADAAASEEAEAPEEADASEETDTPEAEVSEKTEAEDADADAESVEDKGAADDSGKAEPEEKKAPANADDEDEEPTIE